MQAAAAHLGDAPVLVLNGDVPLVTAEALSDLIEAHAAAGAQATVASMELDDPAGYGRVVRRDGRVGRARGGDQGRTATRRAEQLAIREVNAGVYAFDGAALQRRPRAPDARQRPGRALPALDARAARPRRRPSRSTTPRCCSASTTAPTSRACARSPRPASIAGTCARASRSSTRPARSSTSTVAIGADTVIEPSSFLRGATTVGERCAVGPADHADRHGAGRRGPRAALLPRRVRGARRRERRARSPTCAPARCCASARRPAPSSRSRTPTSARAPRCPHLSYIGDADVGPEHEPRRGDDHRQLRRHAASTARRSARTCARRSTRPSSRR